MNGRPEARAIQRGEEVMEAAVRRALGPYVAGLSEAGAEAIREMMLDVAFGTLIRRTRWIRLNRLCALNDMGRTTMERILAEHYVEIVYLGNVPYVSVAEWERTFKEMAAGR